MSEKQIIVNRNRERWLRRHGDGKIFIWNPILAKRKDFYEASLDEVEKIKMANIKHAQQNERKQPPKEARIVVTVPANVNAEVPIQFLADSPQESDTGAESESAGDEEIFVGVKDMDGNEEQPDENPDTEEDPGKSDPPPAAAKPIRRSKKRRR